MATAGADLSKEGKAQGPLPQNVKIRTFYTLAIWNYQSRYFQFTEVISAACSFENKNKIGIPRYQ